MLYQVTPDLWIDYNDLKMVNFIKNKETDVTTVTFEFKSEPESDVYKFNEPEVVAGARELLDKMNILNEGRLNLEAKQLYLNDQKACELIQHVSDLNEAKKEADAPVNLHPSTAHVHTDCDGNHVPVHPDVMCEAS